MYRQALFTCNLYGDNDRLTDLAHKTSTVPGSLIMIQELELLRYCVREDKIKTHATNTARLNTNTA
jgi:hypothetical protein